MKLSFLKFKSIVKDLGKLNSGLNYGYHPASNVYYFRSEIKKHTELKHKADNRGWSAFFEYYVYVSGGSCWTDNPTHTSSTTKSDVHEFDAFITELIEKFKPDITFIQYKKLISSITPLLTDAEHYINEYYGNSTTYYGKLIYLDDLYSEFVNQGLIESVVDGKHAVIIGGLPCSGKTTLAKEAYKGYFLIDDPADMDKDVHPHMRKKKVVITSPHFSFKKDRDEAKFYLEADGYFVDIVLCDEPKNTLYARAKQLKKLDKVKEFIKNSKLEKE